jgi:hypothetical protein
MKKILKILFISLTLVGCLSQNIELKPVNKITDCLIKEITTVKGVKPNWTIETQEFTYDKNGNPTKWIIKEQNNLPIWELRLFYENNKLIRVEKDTSVRDNRQATFGNIVYKFSKHSIKNFTINADFSEMLVERSNYDNYPLLPPDKRPLIPDNQQKLRFSRNPANEIKFDGSDTLQNLGNIKYTAYIYEDNSKNNVLEKHFGEKIRTTYSGVIVTKSNGFWRNVKNPFSANIWLSLVADYNTYSGYRIEGGNWNKNMQSIDPTNNFITTYETNAEGFPCRLTTKNPDFSPYPLEIRYYYLNCDCK